MFNNLKFVKNKKQYSHYIIEAKMLLFIYVYYKNILHHNANA